MGHAVVIRLYRAAAADGTSCCRSAMDSLRKALEEEARLASVLRDENTRAMKEAVTTLKEASLQACHRSL